MTDDPSLDELRAIRQEISGIAIVICGICVAILALALVLLCEQLEPKPPQPVPASRAAEVMPFGEENE